MEGVAMSLRDTLHAVRRAGDPGREHPAGRRRCARAAVAADPGGRVRAAGGVARGRGGRSVRGGPAGRDRRGGVAQRRSRLRGDRTRRRDDRRRKTRRPWTRPIRRTAVYPALQEIGRVNGRPRLALALSVSGWPGASSTRLSSARSPGCARGDVQRRERGRQGLSAAKTGRGTFGDEVLADPAVNSSSSRRPTRPTSRWAGRRSRRANTSSSTSPSPPPAKRPWN